MVANPLDMYVPLQPLDRVAIRVGRQDVEIDPLAVLVVPSSFDLLPGSPGHPQRADLMSPWSRKTAISFRAVFPAPGRGARRLTG